MNTQKQTWQIKDTTELKVVLQDIADENTTSKLTDQLQEYLQSEQQILQKLADHCLQQLTRKQSHIQNLIQFSRIIYINLFIVHMLSQIQDKSQQLAFAQERVQYLEEDLKKANAYNEELMGRLEDVEKENSQYAKREEENSQVISRIEETKSLLLEQLSLQQLRENCTLGGDFGLLQVESGMKLSKRKNIQVDGNNNEDRRNNYMLKSSIHTFKSHLNSQLNTITNPILNSPNTSTHSNRPSPYTQRLILTSPQQQQSQLITIQQHQQQLSTYKCSLQNKQHHINNLQNELHMMKSQISTLSNQLLLKESELELSQIYFKEKLDIVQCRSDIERNEGDNRGERLLDEDDVKAVFRRQLARVESVESLQSVGRSEFSEDPFNNVADLIKQQYAHHSDHNHHSKRSLMQQFFPDFLLGPNQPVYTQQICYTEPFSEVDDQDGRSQMKKALSVSTTDIKRVLSKGVQTVNNSDERVVVRNRKGNNMYNQNQKLQQSFLGSVVSMFTKKPQAKMNTTTTNNKSFSKQQSKMINKESSFIDSSIGLFKGIYDYATKKIVTDRIQKKKSHHNNNNNQSVLEELKQSKKTVYHKGMRCY